MGWLSGSGTLQVDHPLSLINGDNTCHWRSGLEPPLARRAAKRPKLGMYLLLKVSVTLGVEKVPIYKMDIQGWWMTFA